jgi:hypothetical protein
MLKKTLPTILFFVTFQIFSQKHLIIDAIDKKPIPYVTIKYSGGGQYSDGNGEFNLSAKNIENLYFSHINYNNLELISAKFTDTIILFPKSNQLQEVIITKKERKIFNYLKQAKSYSSYPLAQNTELITFLKLKDENSNFDINKFHFQGAAARGIKEDTSFKSVVRVNFYSINENKIINKVYSSEPIYILPNIDKEYSIDLLNTIVELKQAGLGIGIESIGVVDNNGRFSNQKNYIRLALTNKESSEYNQNTVIKYTFSSDIILLQLNKALQIDSDKYLKYNLQFKCNMF